MKYLILFYALVIGNISIAHCQIKAFFAPLEKNVALEKPEWKWRPVVNIPAFKVIESTRADAKVDVLMLSSVGGGFSLQRIKRVNNEPYCQFSWSPFTALLSGNLTANNPINLSIASTIGMFNNYLMAGIGYDLGSVNERSRIFGLLSIGINFNK